MVENSNCNFSLDWIFVGVTTDSVTFPHTNTQIPKIDSPKCCTTWYSSYQRYSTTVILLYRRVPNLRNFLIYRSDFFLYHSLKFRWSIYYHSLNLSTPLHGTDFGTTTFYHCIPRTKQRVYIHVPWCTKKILYIIY